MYQFMNQNRSFQGRIFEIFDKGNRFDRIFDQFNFNQRKDKKFSHFTTTIKFNKKIEIKIAFGRVYTVCQNPIYEIFDFRLDSNSVFYIKLYFQPTVSGGFQNKSWVR